MTPQALAALQTRSDGKDLGYEITQDKETGFIENTNFIHAFTAEKKETFLRLLEDRPFSIGHICKEMGLSKETLYKHFEKDLVFKKRANEIKERNIECIEEKLSSRALTDNGTVDRKFFLKAHKPKVYNPTQVSEQKVTISIDTRGLEQAKMEMEAVDAEIISTPEGDSESVDGQQD